MSGERLFWHREDNYSEVFWIPAFAGKTKAALPIPHDIPLFVYFECTRVAARFTDIDP